MTATTSVAPPVPAPCKKAAPCVPGGGSFFGNPQHLHQHFEQGCLAGRPLSLARTDGGDQVGTAIALQKVLCLDPLPLAVLVLAAEHLPQTSLQAIFLRHLLCCPLHLLRSILSLPSPMPVTTVSWLGLQCIPESFSVVIIGLFDRWVTLSASFSARTMMRHRLQREQAFSKCNVGCGMPWYHKYAQSARCSLEGRKGSSSNITMLARLTAQTAEVESVVPDASGLISCHGADNVPFQRAHS